MKYNPMYEMSFQKYKTLNKYQKLRCSLKAIFYILFHFFILWVITCVEFSGLLFISWMMMCLTYVFVIVSTVSVWIDRKEKEYLEKESNG